jgi:hypothetical protein
MARAAFRVADSASGQVLLGHLQVIFEHVVPVALLRPEVSRRDGGYQNSQSQKGADQQP